MVATHLNKINPFKNISFDLNVLKDYYVVDFQAFWTHTWIHEVYQFCSFWSGSPVSPQNIERRPEKTLKAQFHSISLSDNLQQNLVL